MAMKYAIVQSGGRQYKVEEGTDILIDKLNTPIGSKFDFPQVLLYRNGETVLIGTPFVDSVEINGKIAAVIKGDKIRVSKFKAKVRYRKTMGMRPQYTKIHVENIVFKGKKVS